MSTTAGLDPVSFSPGAPPVLPMSDAEPQLVLETRQQIRLLVQEITKLSESDVSLAVSLVGYQRPAPPFFPLGPEGVVLPAGHPVGAE